MRLKVERLSIVVVISAMIAGSMCFAPVATAQESKGKITRCDVLPRPVQKIRAAFAIPAYAALNDLAWETGDVLGSGGVAADVESMALALQAADAAIERYVIGARRWARHPCVEIEIESMHLLVGELLQMVFNECGGGVLKPLCPAFPLDTTRLDPLPIYELDITGNGLMGTACDAVY